MSESRDIVVFYDSPCIDGAAAAWAINEAYKNQPGMNVEYVAIGHGKPEERTQKILRHLHDGAEAVFVDTSPKDDTLALLFNPTGQVPKIKKLTVLDHHASEVDRLQRFELGQKAKATTAPGGPEFEFIIDAEKPAAALLAWEHFNQGTPAPKLLEWVGRMEPPVRLRTNRDRAIAAFIDSKDIITPKEVFPTIDNLVSLSEDEMVAQGNAILADQLNNIKKGIKSSFVYTRLELLPGREEWIPIVNANVQIFGRGVDEPLLEEACAGTTCGVSGAWFVQEDGTVKLSLRSRGLPSVEEIAEHMGSTIGIGGGGHATAAAVQFDNLAHFAQAVPLYTKEQMMAERWGSNSLGPHAATVKKAAGSQTKSR